VATSAGVEAELGKKKGGDDVSWDDMNLTGPEKKIHAIHSVATNER
jgi:hypothetical protein